MNPSYFATESRIPVGYCHPVNSASRIGKFKGYHSAPIPSPPPPAPPAQAARSAAEELFDASSKFRQLPCRTFISVGTCPYRERCVYLHDPRCICKDAKTKTRRKNKEDMMPDSLFWPVMPYEMVAEKLDANQQPHVIQQYQVPYPQDDKYRLHDRALYSMWMNFVDSCVANSNSDPYSDSQEIQCYKAPDVPINIHTGRLRLPVFMLLSKSNGKSLSALDILECKSSQGVAEKKDDSPLEKKTTHFTSPSSVSLLPNKRSSALTLDSLCFDSSFHAVAAQANENASLRTCKSDPSKPFSPIEQEEKNAFRSPFNQYFTPIESMHTTGVTDNSNSKVCSPDRTTRSASSTPHSFATADFDAKTSKSTDIQSFFDSYDLPVMDNSGIDLRENESASLMSSGLDREGSIDTLDTLPRGSDDLLYPKAQRHANLPSLTTKGESPTRVSPWQFSPQKFSMSASFNDFPEVSTGIDTNGSLGVNAPTKSDGFNFSSNKALDNGNGFATFLGSSLF